MSRRCGAENAQRADFPVGAGSALGPGKMTKRQGVEVTLPSFESLRGIARLFVFAPTSLAVLLAACGGASVSAPGDGGAGSSSGGSSSGSGSGSSSGTVSGSSSGSVSGSSSGGSSSGGSSGGALPAGCPSAPPVNGSSCSAPSLSCQYGTDQDIACDTWSVCTASIWTTTLPVTPSQNPNVICPTPLPGTDGCPSTYPSAGQNCPQVGQCAYPQGLCACHVAGQPWICDDPGAGCPDPRPEPGAACGASGATCNYGSCPFDSGVQMTCTGGVWIAQSSCLKG